jgi:hypothetical protein
MAVPIISEFVKTLNSIDQSKRRSEVFADFCELAFCSLAKVASPFEDQREALETQYMGVVARYTNKDDVRKMPELLGMMMEAIHIGGIDFLGAVAGELGALDAYLGQFFTPYEVSRLMTEMNFSGIGAVIEKEGFVTVSEPAAGAGGMLLAVADKVEELGYDPALHLWVEAIELSRSTFHMAFLQINCRGIAGKVINGNSLSLETYTMAYTAGAAVFLNEHGHPFAKQRKEAAERNEARVIQDQKDKQAREVRLKELVASNSTDEAEQINLFDL